MTFNKEIKEISIFDIEVADRLRSEHDTEALEESLKRDGLQTPIQILKNDKFISEKTTPDEAPYFLIAGYHRLKAALNIGWETIPCFVEEGLNELQSEKLEIIENLIRKDLLAAERISQYTRLREIYNIENNIKGGRPKKKQEEKQEDPIPVPQETPDEKTGDNLSPVSETTETTRFSKKLATDLGVSEKTVKRDLALGSKLDPAALALIAGTDVADNKSELVRLSEYPKDIQVELGKIIKGKHEESVEKVEEAKKEGVTKKVKDITVFEANQILNNVEPVKEGRATETDEEKFIFLLTKIVNTSGTLKTIQERMNLTWSKKTLKEIDSDLKKTMDNLNAIQKAFKTALS